MKKVISIMIVLAVVATAVFATNFNVNAGLGFSYNSGEGVDTKKADAMGEKTQFRAYGFDVQLGFNAEFNNHLIGYFDVDFTFPGNIAMKGADDKWHDADSAYKYDSKFAFALDGGAGYAFHFNAIRLILGGGLHFDMLTFKLKSSPKSEMKCWDMGVNVLVEGDYFFNQHWGLFAALKPTVDLYNSWEIKQGSSKISKDGFAMRFNGAAVVGGTYQF